MHVMAKAIKVVQTIVVNQGKANVQLTLELKVTKKDKGARPSGKAARSCKGHENSNGRTFHGKGHKGKKGGIMGSPSGGLFQVSSDQHGC
jgi:hypothetical protein